jgi:hypothetical protein
MKNIHLIATDKPSRLVLDTVNKNLFLTTTKDFGTKIMQFQNIYITNDEEIKDGDWHLNIVTNKISKYNIGLLNPNRSSYKKIILTTDPDLIADGVQAIDDEFIEWFVKNPSCEWVEIQCRYNFYAGQDLIHYKIIIPQEEPKQETLEGAAEKYARMQCEDLYDNEGLTGSNWGWETSLDFINGAKSNAAKDHWFKIFKEQAKNKFSEEDMIAFGWFCREKSLTMVELLIDKFKNQNNEQ